MSLEQKQVTIGERTYTLHMIDGMKALRVLHRVGNYLGPAMARAIGSLTGSGGLAAFSLATATVDPAKLGDAVASFFDRMTEDQLDQLVRDLLATTMVELPNKDGQVVTVQLIPVIGTAMKGRTGDLLQLLKEAWELNYGPLSVYLGGLLKQHLPRAQQPSTSPQA